MWISDALLYLPAGGEWGLVVLTDTPVMDGQLGEKHLYYVVLPRNPLILYSHCGYYYS